MAYRSTSPLKLNGFIGILLLVAFFVAIFFIMRGVFFVLQWVAPALLVAAFIIDRRVIIDYVKWLGRKVKSNPLFGIGAILFTIFGYMLVFPYLFAKTVFKKKLKEVHRQYEIQEEGEFIDYEEVSDEPSGSIPLELPRLERRERKKQNDYDNMFE